MSYPLFARHAELVSASFCVDDKSFIPKALNQIQGDVLVMTVCGHSNIL